MERQGQRGFTLIELMVAVAIVAILASIAYPAYTRQVQKGARRAAQAQMLDLANREQQYLLSNRAYATYTQLKTAGYSMPSEVSSKYQDIDTVITVGSSTVPSFTITFTPFGAQLSDGELTLTSEGVKGPSGKW